MGGSQILVCSIACVKKKKVGGGHKNMQLLDRGGQVKIHNCHGSNPSVLWDPPPPSEDRMKKGPLTLKPTEIVSKFTTVWVVHQLVCLALVVQQLS